MARTKWTLNLLEKRLTRDLPRAGHNSVSGTRWYKSVRLPRTSKASGRKLTAIDIVPLYESFKILPAYQGIQKYRIVTKKANRKGTCRTSNKIFRTSNVKPRIWLGSCAINETIWWQTWLSLWCFRKNQNYYCYYSKWLHKTLIKNIIKKNILIVFILVYPIFQIGMKLLFFILHDYS